MNDDERPAIYVEVTATDFDGVRVIFADYKIGDAPLLVVNCLSKDPVSFCQMDDMFVSDFSFSSFILFIF